MLLDLWDDDFRLPFHVEAIEDEFNFAAGFYLGSREGALESIIHGCVTCNPMETTSSIGSTKLRFRPLCYRGVDDVLEGFSGQDLQIAFDSC